MTARAAWRAAFAHARILGNSASLARGSDGRIDPLWCISHSLLLSRPFGREAVRVLAGLPR